MMNALATVAACCLISGAAAGLVPNPKTNIVIILADVRRSTAPLFLQSAWPCLAHPCLHRPPHAAQDFGYGDPGYNGGVATTPHLDAMSRGEHSIQWSRFYCGGEKEAFSHSFLSRGFSRFSLSFLSSFSLSFLS